LPGAELPHYPFAQPGDNYWTPADWAWAGGLLDVLLPSLHHGVPVIARMRVAWTKPEGQSHAVGLAFFADGPAQRDSIERMRDYLAARRRALLGVAV